MTMRRFTLRDTSEAAYNFRMWRGDLPATVIAMNDAEARESDADPRDRWMDAQENAWKKD